MKKVLKNKKGFTLVELLAVIVILALIMGIAVAAMSGVIGDSQKNSARRTAASIIDGVRQKLTLEGELKTGVYQFTNAILERGGVTSPFGGNYVYATTAPSGSTAIGKTGVYRTATTVTTNDKKCEATTTSYVIVEAAAGTKTQYYVCLTSGTGYEFIAGSESDILADKDGVVRTTTVTDITAAVTN